MLFLLETTFKKANVKLRKIPLLFSEYSLLLERPLDYLIFAAVAKSDGDSICSPRRCDHWATFIRRFWCSSSNIKCPIHNKIVERPFQNCKLEYMFYNLPFTWHLILLGQCNIRRKPSVVFDKEEQNSIITRHFNHQQTDGFFFVSHSIQSLINVQLGTYNSGVIL